MARHAATDGSFGRSATGAAARGGVLLVIAVVLGIVLLHSGSGDPYTRSLRATGNVRNPVTSLPVATTVTVPLRAPAEVKVLPANGTGASGAAGRTGDKLKAAGYNVLAATNTTKQPVSSSAVYFKPGLEREARVVATLLALPDSTVQPLPTPAPRSLVASLAVFSTPVRVRWPPWRSVEVVTGSLVSVLIDATSWPRTTPRRTRCPPPRRRAGADPAS